jgi:hypothetical protein
MRFIAQAVDHISVVTSDAAGWFELHHVRLGIPVAWPLADFGMFLSGGLRVGEVNVEVLQPEPGADIREWPHRVVTFRPDALSGLVEELDRRGVVRSEPEPFTAPGQAQPLYTNLSLPELSGPDCAVQLCAYHGYDPRRVPPGTGGPLGVRRLELVRLGVAGADVAAERWARLFEPIEGTAERIWRLPQGPAVQVRRAERTSLLGLDIVVDSVPTAVRVLEAAGVVVDDRGGAQLFGLPVALTL